MKATEGSSHNDRKFSSNWKEAKKHGLMRGAYHYFSAHTPGDKQARKFISKVKIEKGDLPPMVDVEEEPKDAVAFRKELKKFIAEIEKHYGVKPIIYTSYKYKLRYLDAPEFDAYPFWIAHYYVDELSYNGEWQFWQHTDYGTVPGIEGSVDLNVFNGTLSELKRYTVK